MPNLRSHALLALAAGVVLALAAPVQAAVLDLGDAADYGLLAVPNTDDVPDVNLFASAKVTGDIAVGTDGSFTMFSSGPGRGVFGDLYLAPGVSQSFSSGANLTGAIFTNVDLSQAIADALQASLDAAALTPTQTFGTVNSTTTWISAGGVNVIDVTTIDLGALDVLTLSGASSDYFIINVSTGFNMSGSSQIVTSGGLNPNHVLFNFDSTGDPLSMTAVSSATGTFLAPFRDAQFDGALVSGAVIANDIRIGSSGELFHVPFEPPPPPPPSSVIPEPASSLLLGLGLLGGAFGRRRKASSLP